MQYPIFKLEEYLGAREFSAPHNLCASDLETHSMQEIVSMADDECQHLWNTLPLSYTEPKGHPILREEIAKQYGDPLKMDHILCFAGAEEGIYSMAHALLSKDDHVIAIAPCYQSLESVAGTICETTEVSLKYEEEWKIDLIAIEEAIKPNTKLIVINFPHNPTGALITHEEQKTLIEIARKHDLWIFSDEVYRFLEIDESDRIPAIASAYEKGLSLSVMSKAYGLAGLRIGWIACQDVEMLYIIEKVKHYLSICNSAPSEILSLITLRNSEQVLKRNRDLMNDNLALLDSFFEEYADWFEWVRPKGGCIGYPLFKGNQDINTLADDLLEDCGVLILPAKVYDDPNNHFRISFGRASMPDVLALFKGFIDKKVVL